MTEQAGSRRFDVSYKSGTSQTGAEALEFFSQNGKMTIVSSIFVKEGYAYAINHDQLLRVGSTDLTFKNPLNQEDFFHHLENNAGIGIRCYTNQALFCTKIGHQLVFTGVA
jgi:1,4-alpha-glucan branching enzyme